MEIIGIRDSKIPSIIKEPHFLREGVFVSLPGRQASSWKGGKIDVHG